MTPGESSDTSGDMKRRTRWQGVALLVLCVICLSMPAAGSSPDLQLDLSPAPIARGETLTLMLAVVNSATSPLDNTTLYVPLPVGIDQWGAEVRVDGGAWDAYPANGLIDLSPIHANGTMDIELRMDLEQASSATLSVTAQLLDATGILASITGAVNVLPNVDAGPDLIVDLGSAVSLIDASASDGGGGIASYTWSDLGVGGAFNDPAVLHPTYTPPAISGVVELTLTVTDSDGGTSSDSLRVRVNAPPLLDAGTDLEAEEGARIALGGASVSDPDGWISEMRWDDGGASGAFLPSNDVMDPVYLVPSTPGCEDERVRLTLTVTDDWGATSTDGIDVVVRNVNAAPTLHLPDSMDVTAGARVDLAAIAQDSDGWIAHQAWEQIEGIPVELSEGSLPQEVSFDAPAVAEPLELWFRFRATDNCGDDVWDDVLVIVSPMDAPTASPPSETGSITVQIDLFDERGFPLSPFDTPQEGQVLTVRVTVLNSGGSPLSRLSAWLNEEARLPLDSPTLAPWSRTRGSAEWKVPWSDDGSPHVVDVVVTGQDDAERTVRGTDRFQFQTPRSAETDLLQLEVTLSAALATVGERVDYRYVLRNAGSQELEGLSLVDDRFGQIPLLSSRLLPGQAREAVVTYIVLDSDLPGPLVNRAELTGFTSAGRRLNADATVSLKLAGGGESGGDIDGGGGAAASTGAPRLVISEVAWAGNPRDGTREWIELANLGGSSVDLSGWQLAWYEKGVGIPPAAYWQRIDLSGVIDPMSSRENGSEVHFTDLGDGLWAVSDPRWADEGATDGFFVLERGHDDAIENLTADAVYGDRTTPFFELPDHGAVLMLMDPSGMVVDSANAQYPSRMGWPAGDAMSGATMERIDLWRGDYDGNWQTSPSILTYGKDAWGHRIAGTPGQPNALSIERLLDEAGQRMSSVASHETISVSIPGATASERPSILMTAGPGGAGGGGTVSVPELSIIRGGDELRIETSLDENAEGAFFIWISLENATTFVLPLVPSSMRR